MFLIYHLTFSLGNPLSDLIDNFFAYAQNVIKHYLPDGILKDFLVEGIIGGVGGVLVFFPIVLLLFLGLSFLEDTGYMARAAFVMDKFMHIFGLHGRSFIPMMVSTGCAVPGVMSARTLVNPKDRVLTIFISPQAALPKELKLMPSKVVMTGIFFIFIFFFGFWLSRTGKPYNALIFNAHKLIGLAMGVFLIITVYRLHQAAPFSPLQVAALALTILIFIILVAAGGVISAEAAGEIKNMAPTILGMLSAIHKILPYLAVLSTAATLYLLLFRKV